VLIWNTGSQTYESYWYCETGGVYGPDYDGHWLDDLFDQATNTTVNNGKGFWINSIATNDQELLLHGEAYLGVTNEVNLLQGFNLIANPYAAKMKVGSNESPTDFATDKEASELTVYARGGFDPGSSDALIFWDDTLQKYTSYWFCETYGVYGSGYDGHLLDDSYVAQDSRPIELGKGVWYKNNDTNTVTWVKQRPY
jgi:hypothetical protein